MNIYNQTNQPDPGKKEQGFNESHYDNQTSDYPTNEKTKEENEGNVTNQDNSVTNRDAGQSSYDDEPVSENSPARGGDGERSQPEIQTPDHEPETTEEKIPNMGEDTQISS